MKEIKYDLKAGYQRFTYDKKDYTINVPIDATNPIDTRLRQIGLQINPVFDFKKEFYEKWAVVMTGNINNMQLRKGRIKDIYFQTRDIRIKTRRGDDVVVGFGKVITVSTYEP